MFLHCKPSTGSVLLLDIWFGKIGFCTKW